MINNSMVSAGPTPWPTPSTDLRFGPVHDACTVEAVVELLQSLKVTLGAAG